MPDNVPTERQRARVRWLCRRGMKELDVLLSRYFDRRYDRAGTAEQAAFARLLAHQDPDLYDLILGSSAAADPEEAHVIDELRQYARA